MGQEGWHGPHRWYEVRCPHCSQRHDLREFDYVLVGQGDQQPTFTCENSKGKGCRRKFQIVKVEDVKLIWTRPVT